jgi:ribulose-phosphate 3-epimerase
MTNHSPIIAPSILAADLANIESEIQKLERAGADWLHVDVMDGAFVPAITFGDNMVRSLSTVSDLFLDVHLMVENPERHIERFVSAGSDRVIIHEEATRNLKEALASIRSHGVKNGVALNPKTPLDTILPILDFCDLVLIMTVQAGAGGQPFIPACLEKIKTLSEAIQRAGTPTLIEVDGGINVETGRQCVAAGASILVAGTYILKSNDPAAAIQALR